MSSIVRMNQPLEIAQGFNQEQIDILKNSICKGLSNDELQIFIMACQKTQLDPFMRQIYAVKRYDSRLGKEVMTIQTGIDGYRLIAERTGCYAPGSKPTFEYDDQGAIIAATAYVKKLTQDGTWHIVDTEAYMDEYCQTYFDKKTGETKPMGMWKTMPRNQLAKCAEALALRRCFPKEMSGIYTREEMGQAQNDAEFTDTIDAVEIAKPSTITEEQVKVIKDEIGEDAVLLQDFLRTAKTVSVETIKPERYDAALNWLLKVKKYRAEKGNAYETTLNNVIDKNIGSKNNKWVNENEVR